MSRVSFSSKWKKKRIQHQNRNKRNEKKLSQINFYAYFLLMLLFLLHCECATIERARACEHSSEYWVIAT